MIETLRKVLDDSALAAALNRHGSAPPMAGPGRSARAMLPARGRIAGLTGAEGSLGVAHAVGNRYPTRDQPMSVHRLVHQRDFARGASVSGLADGIWPPIWGTRRSNGPSRREIGSDAPATRRSAPGEILLISCFSGVFRGTTKRRASCWAAEAGTPTGRPPGAGAILPPTDRPSHPEGATRTPQLLL